MTLSCLPCLIVQTTDRDLEDAFSKFGSIQEVRVVTDRDSGRPRGFGFVTFKDLRDATDAMAAMNGVDLQGREIRVDHSTPRGSTSRGGPGGGRGYGGGGGGGGGRSRACFDFQKGDCRYGDSCRFSHEGGEGGGGYDDRRGGGYDDRRGDDRRGGGGYNDRRGGGGYDDRRGGGGGYNDRRGGGGYDDRRGGGGYDDRRGGGGHNDRRGDDRRGGGRGAW